MADMIKIEMYGDELFHRKLRSMARRSLDFSPVLRRIGIKWVGWIEEQFGTEGVRFNGVKWTNLSFRRIKERGGQAHPILFDHGDLFDEMTSITNVKVDDHSLTLDPKGREAYIGNIHQKGLGHNPQREILNFTHEDRREMLDDLGDFLFERGRGRVL
jgi:hypothetical protein